MISARGKYFNKNDWQQGPIKGEDLGGWMEMMHSKSNQTINLQIGVIKYQMTYIVRMDCNWKSARGYHLDVN